MLKAQDTQINAGPITYEKYFSGKDEKLGSFRLLIPPFQRNYVWSAKHIKDFIKSINDNEKGFYIGNILIQNSVGSGGRDLIIDGQQRLVTLSIIIHNLKIEGINDQRIDTNLFSKEDEKTRLKFSREILQSVYEENLKEKFGKDKKSKNANAKKIANAFNLVKKEVSEISDLNDFLNKIMSLEFVVIKCPYNYDTSSLFEGLNSKGKALNPVELTKNSLLGFTKDENDFGQVAQVWEKIEKSFEKENILWFDKFLRHRSFSQYGYISSSNLFSRIKMTLKEEDVLSFSEELKKDADSYLSLRNGDISESVTSSMQSPHSIYLKHLLKLLKSLELHQAYAPLLALYKYGIENSEYFKRKSFYEDVRKIFIFSLLAKYMEVIPSKYERIFANFCKNIFDKTKTFQSIKTTFFEELKKLITDKDKFVSILNNKIRCEDFKEKIIQSHHDRNFIRSILLIVSEDFSDITEECTIEHIIPKTENYREKWSHISKSFDDKLRFSLGNLTIIKNDDCGDEIYTAKVEKYKQSEFILTKKLKAKKYIDGFMSEDPSAIIKQRGKEIASSLYEKLTK